MWNKMFSIESLRLAAVISFIKFSKERAPEVFAKDSPETLPEDIEALQELLPIADVERIVREHVATEATSDDNETVVMAIELSSPEEMEEKMREIIAELVTRLISNIFALGAQKNILDVCFDSDDDSFAFTLTEKGKKMCAAYHNPPEDTHDAPDAD